MSRTESSDETYKPSRITTSSIVESLDDEPFLGYESVDVKSLRCESPSDDSHPDSSDVDNDEDSSKLDYICNENPFTLKCVQKSLNEDSSFEFSSSPGDSYSRALGALQDDATSSPRGNRAVVGDVLEFAEANKASTIDDRRFKSMKNYFFTEKYTIHKPSTIDLRYDVIKENGYYGLSVSRAQLERGLRFPIHPFVQKILKQSGISLSQLLPNSFLNINAFIDRCFDKGVKRHSAIFWTHFRLLSNKVKSPGFYTIALKPNSQKWVVTPGDYHCGHKDWFYVTGPGLKKFTKWKSFEAVSFAPELTIAEQSDYAKLLEPDSDSMILSQKESRSEAYLIDIGVSGVDAKLERLQQRLLKAKQNEDAETHKKGGKKVVKDKGKGQKCANKRVRGSSHDISTGVSDKEVCNQTLMITDGGDPSHSDIVARDGNHATKMMRVGDSTFTTELPEKVLEKASKSSIILGKFAKKMFSRPGDQATSQEYPRAEGFEHMLGHFAQAYSWAIQLSENDGDADKEKIELKKSYESEVKKLRTANTKIGKLEKEMTSLMSKVGVLEDQLSSARSNDQKLNEVISAKTKEVEAAEENWYKVAVDRKLKKAKELFGEAYVGLVDPWDKDPNMEELSPVDTSSSSAGSQTHDETLVGDANKEKSVAGADP